MGTGKTSVGKELAPKLGLRAVDVDTHIETTQKKRISEIFSESGEAHFRVLEKNAIRELAAQQGLVITTGGGAVLDGDNLKALRENGIIIALLASPETIYERVKKSKRRPLLQKDDVKAEIDKLYGQRAPLYQNADLKFDTDGQTSAEVADRIYKALKDRQDWGKR
jgi:shikimate kinase